jgi:hypothetical protein
MVNEVASMTPHYPGNPCHPWFKVVKKSSWRFVRLGVHLVATRGPGPAANPRGGSKRCPGGSPNTPWRSWCLGGSWFIGGSS